MCGIAGIISGESYPEQQLLLQKMADALSHRGPVGDGFWINEQQKVAFAHRRLAIIDLTSAASQPLHYLHYTIIFNGEIYNYKELKALLVQQGYAFYTTGDTELIPAAYDYWGIDFLHKLDGMFAFALYDHNTQSTIIIRDRFGEKPLYYTKHPLFNEEPLVFASEMKALWAVDVPQVVDQTMMLNYITLGYVQNPIDKTGTFFKNIYSLPPAHYLKIESGSEYQGPVRWYYPEKEIAKQDNTNINEAAAIEKFTELFYTSINRRLRSDVPVGTSLSGGLDSSSVVAFIQDCIKKEDENIVTSKAFSAVFPGFELDEYRYSKEVTERFSMQHYCISPGADDLANHWETMMFYQEEPVQSSSVFTQFMVYRLASEHNITVLLDGQGADEILGGYKKYMHWYLQQLFLSNLRLFRKEKQLLQQHQLLTSWDYRNIAAALFPGYAAKQLQHRALQQQQHAPFLNQDYLKAYIDPDILFKPTVRSLESVLYYNSFVFGLEELLRYADRNSMAHSREVRLPFLFHELVEFVFSLPAHYKIRDGFTKWILRKAVCNKLPENITWRTDKVGFEPPQKAWMQQPSLVPLIMESRSKLVNAGILSKEIMKAPVMAGAAHDGGNYDWRWMNAAWMIKA